LISQSRILFTKNLFTDGKHGPPPQLIGCADEAEQCTLLCEQVLAKLEEGIGLKEQAVLFRAGHHSAALEVELARRNIPFVKYGGLKFLESAHVKDVLGLPRSLENPCDELAWWRVLRLADGIGPGSARRIIAAIGAFRDGDEDAAPEPHGPLK